MRNPIVSAIQASGLTIYDCLANNPSLYLGTAQLQDVLSESLHGLCLDYPLRTRSKIIKQECCRALGYPIPKSFKKTQPRFPGQDFDTYVQKSNNLQMWNEKPSASRRYVLVRVDESSLVTAVRVVTGNELVPFDATGKLTHKFQASSRSPITQSVLVSTDDTLNIRSTGAGGQQVLRAAKEIKEASGVYKFGTTTTWRPMSQLYADLIPLIGRRLSNRGLDQERLRGAELHRAVCECLGIASFHDNGQFPDVPAELLEVKLQTSRTIDLGLVDPASEEHLANLVNIRHCDVRYAIFYGTPVGSEIILEHLVLTSGEDFFTFFQQFQGLVSNSKLQFRLPASFWS